MKALRTGLSGVVVLASALMSVGCGGTAEDVGSLIDSINSIADATAAAIQDGSSNTIQFGEQPVGGANQPPSGVADDQTSAPALVDGTPSAGAAAPPSTPSATPVISQEAVDALGDKFFSFGSSSGNSDNNAFVTGTTELQLCRFGKFGMRETTIFSSSIGTFDSTSNSLGSWTVLQQRGRLVLRLTIEQTNDSNPVAEQNFELVFNNGGVSFDGSQADVSDATAECAAAEQSFANP